LGTDKLTTILRFFQTGSWVRRQGTKLVGVLPGVALWSAAPASRAPDALRILGAKTNSYHRNSS